MLRSERRKASSSHPNLAANAVSGSLPTSPAMRRRRKETECLLKLERVLGLTSNKPMILSVNSIHDLVAYAAGCVVVLYSHKLDKQVGVLCSSTLKKPPSSDSSAIGSGTATGVAVGSGATGSGSRGITTLGGSPRTAMSSQWMNSALASPNINPLAGLMPMAISDGSIASSFGTSNPSSNKNIKPKPISCLSFSPDGQFLAIGETGHQPRILIWEVASHMLVGELQGHKFGVQAVHFSPNSRHLVSVGFQHDGCIHVWNWRTGLQISSNRVTTKVNALAFSSDGSYFVTAGLRHVKFWYLNVGPSKRGGSSSTAPNIQVLDGRSGILGELRDGNYVDAVCSKDGRFTYTITSNGILCLFSEGRALEKWIDLHVRGAYSVNLDEKFVICACTDGIIRLFEPETLEYIESLPKPLPVGAFSGAMQPNAREEEDANPVYADVLASQYDISSGCLICIYSDRSLFVWDISDPKNAILSRSHLFHSDCVWGSEILPSSDDEGAAHQFPAGTFVTYSADGSIKFWNLDESISMLPPISGAKDDDTRLRMLNREILKVLYVDENCKSWIQAPENQDGMEPGFNIVPLECGIRTVKISSDGRFLASGDKGGNLRVHSLSTLQQVTYQEAHDTEILTIDFTDPTKDSPFLVATAGRDRLLHVFDVDNDYALVQTLDDHSSSITCIRFTADGSRMMSCGADKSIIFRSCHKNTDGISYQPYHQAPGRATFYDMGLDDASQTLSVVSGDRRFNIFALDTGKAIKSFKAETKGDDITAGMAEICSMTHISLDPTGTIAAASGSDKSIRIYDLLHGTCLAHTICHSELVTSVKFMKNFDRIISTSADGCVLVWRLSKDVVRRILNRMQENVTLPGYIQAKAAELLVPNMPAATPSPRTLKFKPSMDRFTGAYASENSGASRRNSATSVMSEDCDIRSEENSDDMNDQRQSGALKDAKAYDVSRESFAPVTVRAPGVRSRVTGSISKTPLTRPRQNSSPQPGALRSQPSSSRSGAHHDPPPWNRNIVKERITPSPSVKLTQPVSPGLHAPKNAAKGTWLSPKIQRPRANSMTAPNETTFKSNDAKVKDLIKQRQFLGDYTRDDPSEKGENDDDGLSDETESVLNNGPEFSPPVHHAAGGAPKTNRVPTKGLGHDLPTLRIKPHARSRTADSVLISQSNESDQAVSESDALEENGASEERDGDDEEVDGDDSISETGSDNDILSPLQRRNVGPGGIQDLKESIGDFTSFQDGERIKDSPQSERSYQVTSPGGHVASARSAAGRRSLSSKFLTANAAIIMMGLTQRPLHSSPPAAGDDSRDSGSGNGQEAKDDLLMQGSFDNPLEGHPNLQSLNAAAMKWKHRSLSVEPRAVVQGSPLDQNDNTYAGLTSDDYYKEVERTRQRLVELGYLTMPTGTVQVQSSSGSEITAKTPTEPQEAKVTVPAQLGVGVLASPVIVGSPEGNKLGNSGPARSLDRAMNIMQHDNDQALEAAASDRALGAETQAGRQDGEQSLRNAFDRISFLISHKAMTAIPHEGRDGADDGALAERVHETKKWMMETREGLLNLVGEVQGHLWALEKSQ